MAAAEDYSISDPADFPPGRFPARVPLGPDCWYESALARVISQDKEIPLTPREDALIWIMLPAPETWHETGDLADLLAKRCHIEEVSLQSVRQTVKGLRNKLNQSTASPDLIQCRPGHGYGIFPPKTTNHPGA